MTDRPTALITGGARGIGFACAEAIAGDGARIVVADIDRAGVEAAAGRLGGDSVAIRCDMGNPAQIAAMFERIAAQIGPLSVLVNCAGIAIPRDFLETSLEEFTTVIDVNLIGTFLATQLAARSMVAAGIRGSIVNMSSVNDRVAIPAIAAYCASKGGVTQLTKASALALAPHGIRVNAVGPGSIDTAMMAAVNENPEAMRVAMSRTPLKRMGTPGEVADLVAFLASDKASYITGETVYVDGGRLALNYTC